MRGITSAVHAHAPKPDKPDVALLHSISKCPILFGNWFQHLIVVNMSIVLNFYQQRPGFALKNHPRPQRPKKVIKGQNFKKSLISSIVNVKSSMKGM